MHHGEAWQRVVADVERAAAPGGRRSVGCMVIEGVRLHERALRAGARFRAVLISERAASNPDPRLAALREELAARCPSHVVPDAVVRRLNDGRRAGDPVGLVELPPQPELAALLAARRSARFLVATDVEDPGNNGALIRTALACGAAAWIGVGISDPFHPKAVRTSMGGVFKLPLVRRESAEELIEELAAAGVRCLGAVASGGDSIARYRALERPVALFVGSEAHGLSERLVEALDGRLTVPTSSEVDSLSVNAAAAILLFQLSLEA